MAAANTNTSDLDHANATITQLVSNLHNFKEACEKPSDDPSIYERLQQLRINTIHGDLANIREDLNSVRQRLESAAESAAASNEEDAAKRKEKQANLDRAIQAAEERERAAEEREREAKKSEERLSAAIKFANDRATEAQEMKAKAREKKAEAEEKNKAAEKMMQDANAKQDEAGKERSDAQHLNQKRKLVELEDQAVQDRNKIARLETNLAGEKKDLEKAMLQQQEVNGQYSLLARLDITKTSTISSRPDLETIIRRAVGLTQSTSDVEAASILDSTNTDLPEGTQLIADVSPNVFFMITATGKVDIFDKADIQQVEYDCSLRMRLIMDGKSLLICDTPNDVAKSAICERWMKRSGVVLTLVLELSM